MLRRQSMKSLYISASTPETSEYDGLGTQEGRQEFLLGKPIEQWPAAKEMEGRHN